MYQNLAEEILEHPQSVPLIATLLQEFDIQSLSYEKFEKLIGPKLILLIPRDPSPDIAQDHHIESVNLDDNIFYYLDFSTLIFTTFVQIPKTSQTKISITFHLIANRILKM